MNHAVRLLILLMMMLSAMPIGADVFKYVDADGKIYFTDEPLKGRKYKLEWKRESKKLITENQRRLAALSAYKSKSKRVSKPRRGKAVTLPKALSKRRARFAALIEANARRYKLQPELLHAVIRTESAYNPSAVSHAGATGLMQLMPATAARYGVNDIRDPTQNIRGGAAYLRELLDMFDQDLRLALAGYNAGEGAVMKYGRRIPPYKETQNYVRKVMQFLWAEQSSTPSLSISLSN